MKTNGSPIASGVAELVGCPPFRVPFQAKAWTPNNAIPAPIAEEWGAGLPHTMKTKRSPLAFGLALLGTVLCAAAAAPESLPIPPAREILAKLHPGHPRLLASESDFARLKERVATDPQLKEWHARLRAEGRRLLDQPVSKYEIPDGLRLLSTSRRVLDRQQTLGLLHRLEGDRRYVERAWQELEAAVRFPDWNPRHFLDTAEMTHAFAIGYDWLYDQWTEAQRAVLRQAIVERGLKLGVACHRGGTTYGWWTRSEHNWNQVCNGGIGMGALALADVEPELAGEFLAAALKSIQLPMRRFAPDGAWDEGPGYWNYATSYNVIFLAALETALGTDFGLSHIPGFAEAGMFPIYITGPLGKTFNYADGGEGAIRAPQMFWLARRFDRPAYAAYERKVASADPLDLLWFMPGGSGKADLPLDRYFREAEVVTFRSAWEDRDALFVGFKAGDNKANHSNLDLGSFVLDALGVRWVADLGADNYNLPGYFGGQRWTYYRLRAEGHNTVILNPGPEPDQDPKGAARIAKYEARSDRAIAIADLTPAYAQQARQAKRGIAVLGRRQVLVQDEIAADKPMEVWWFLHTPAEIQVAEDGRSAILMRDGRRLRAQLLSPDGARLTVMDARPLPTSPQPEQQARNEGIRKLAIHVTDAKDLRLAVLLVPLPEGERAAEPPPGLTPLSDW